MTQKAKRKLSEISFDHEGAHLALCSKSQGAANNWNKALIMKGHNFSPEFIQKMQSVQVTMPLPEFLQKFFGLWYEDAEILARLMGYVPEEKEDWDYDDYIEERLSAFAILKSLHEAKNLPDALSKLTEQDYLDVLTDQAEIEKVLKAFDNKKSDTSTDVENTKVEVSTSKVTKKNKGKQMTQETEMVEKSALTAVEKALEDQKIALEKALAQVKQYEDEKKEAIVKSKTDAVKAVVKDEKQAAVVVKAALALEDQADFDALIAVFKSMNALLEKSGLFQEQGVSAEAAEDKPGETKLMKALKARHQAKQ